MKKRFHKINIEISNICNLQCSFCPEVIRTKKLMDLNLFDQVVSQAAPLTELVCLHLMGDPLVHPDIDAMVSICEKYQAPVFLVSNGVLLRESHVQTLLRPAFYQVNFSLHSFFDNFPDRSPDIYLERIFEFTERALKERPELYLNYRLWNLESPQGGSHQNREMLERIQRRFHWKYESQDVRQKKSHRIQGRLYLHLDTEFVWPALNLPVLGEKGTCKGLSDHFGILAEGTIVPCCLDKEGDIPLGNIREQTLLEILDSPRAMAIRQGFRNRQLKEDLCRRCQYIERFA